MTEEQINGVWIRSGLSLDLQDQAVHEFARAIIAQARAGMRAELDAAFNRGMFVAAGIVVTAHDMPTVAEEIIRSVGPAAVKDVGEYDAGVLAPHFPQFAPYAPKE